MDEGASSADPFAAYRTEIHLMHDTDPNASAKARGILEKHKFAVEALEQKTSAALAKLIGKHQKARAADEKKALRSSKRGSRVVELKVNESAAGDHVVPEMPLRAKSEEAQAATAVNLAEGETPKEAVTSERTISSTKDAEIVPVAVTIEGQGGGDGGLVNVSGRVCKEEDDVK